MAEDIRALICALESSDKKVSADARKSIEKIGMPAFHHVLDALDAMGQENGRFDLLVEILTKIIEENRGDERLTDAVIPLLKKRTFVPRWENFEGFTFGRNPWQEEKLEGEDKREFTRTDRLVIRALAAIGKPALPKILEAMKEKTDINELKAAVALGTMGDRSLCARVLKLASLVFQRYTLSKFQYMAFSNSRIFVIEALMYARTPSAVPTLMAIYQKHENLWDRIENALAFILNVLKTKEEIEDFERKISEEFVLLKKGKKDEEDLINIKMDLSRLMMSASIRKNEMASKKDILLHDIPKPPKGGKMYRSLKAGRNQMKRRVI